MKNLFLFAGIVLLCGCASDWTAFRGDTQRSGYQTDAGALSDPTRVRSMSPTPAWTFHPSGAQGFRASPIVFANKVLIGNGNGYFYAVDAQHGNQLWQYPAPPNPALTSQFICNPSSHGIASSATVGFTSSHLLTPIVVFGAPDQSIGTGLGEGRLFALNANNGNEIWKSPVLAHISGLTPNSTSETHEQLGYSSPLLYNDKLYIGIANHCDDPIQLGRIVSVDFASGSMNPGFTFVNGLRPGNTSPPGGDVWGSVAADEGALFATTGNTARWMEGEPVPDRALSLIRLDPSSGNVQWQHQPVPYVLDADPDWSATPTVMHASCGDLVVGTQKDGWTWAVGAAQTGGSHPNVRWVFPADNPSWINGFTTADGTVHGDTDYTKPGAAWGDVYVTMDGGEDTVDNINIGFSQLHALNVCADDAHRIRWIATLPGGYLGPPVITHGIVYVGTDSGHLVALADPSIAPAAGWICAKTSVSNAQCTANGFSLVPQPATLLDMVLDGGIYTEPVLSEKNLYVATDSGTLYMFDP